MTRYLSPDSSDARARAGWPRRGRRAGSRAARSRRRSVTRFCAWASSTIPSTEPSSSVWYSPVAGLLDARARAARAARSTAAAKTAISATARPSSSSRSAPATRSLRSPHCQMQSPAAAASVSRVSAVREPLRAAEDAGEQDDADARGERDQRRDARRSRCRARRRRRGCHCRRQPADLAGRCAGSRPARPLARSTDASVRFRISCG